MERDSANQKESASMNLKFSSFREYLDWLSHNQNLFSKDSRKRQPPIHPGRFLSETYLKKKKITQTQLAKMLGCTHARVNEIVNGKRKMTPKFALQLEKALGEPAELWVSLQASYDLWCARQKQAGSE